MAYLVIAYPQLSIEDLKQIQDYRSQNDALYYNVIAPHFTLVFPVFDVSENDFIDEVRTKAKYFEKTRFTIRCAVINKDAFSDYFHTFLVPDEGFSKIVKWHDILYSDKLKNNLKLDIDFIPHITIGNSTDKFLCKKMVDTWNEKEFEISGLITHITIIKYENSIVSHIEEIELC